MRFLALQQKCGNKFTSAYLIPNISFILIDADQSELVYKLSVRDALLGHFASNDATCLAAGQVFAPASTRGFRRFAYTSLVVILLSPFSEAVFNAIVARGSDLGYGCLLNFSFTSNDTTLHFVVESASWSDIATAVLLIFVAHAFLIAERLQEEAESFL